MRSSRSNCSFTVEFSLIQEAILVQNERITQLYTIQSEQDPFVWFGVLFVDSGIYMGAVIRFTMIINENYPNSPCPRIILDPIPYHALVNPRTGELDTKNAFPNWDSKTNKIHQLLLFLKRVICNAESYIKQIEDLINQYCVDNESSSHPERQGEFLKELTDSKNNTQLSTGDRIDGNAQYHADLVNLFDQFDHTLNFIRTYENDPHKFQTLIEAFKQRCCQNLYERPRLFGDDKNSIVFSEWNDDIHEPIRNLILAGKFTPVSLFASYHKESDSVSFVPGAEPPDC